jgi:uncharacterized membrane protein YqhA
MSTDNPNKRSRIADKLEVLFNLRYVALVVSLLLMICGILAIVFGISMLVEAVGIMIGINEGRAGIYLIEAVDTFLFAVVILILSGGIFKLFVGHENTLKHSTVYANIENFKDLKVLLWETILLTLTVWCSLSFFLNPDKLTYDMLIFPASIVLLALALRLLKGKHND